MTAPEAPEIAWLHTSYRMFVDGTFTEGGGERLATVNPATGEVLAEVSTASGADVDSAVRAARRAYDRVWPRLAGAERAAQFFYHAGWADKLAYAGYGPDPRPLGVTGQIIGPDAALLTAARKIAPALACGNTVVLKPAETTPLTALVLAEICQQADLPPGVLNVLPGASDVGVALVTHDGLNNVAFTGSTDVGAVSSNSRLARIRDLSDSADAAGAQRWTSPAPLPEQGFYCSPTVFSGVRPTMRIAREPIIGPVLAVLTFTTPDEAAALVNNIPRSARFDPTSAFGGYREPSSDPDGGRAGLAAYLDV